MADTITDDYPTVYGWVAKVPAYESPVDIPDSFAKFADSIPGDVPIATGTGATYTIQSGDLQTFFVNTVTSQTPWTITAGLDVGFQFSIHPNPNDDESSIILVSSDESEGIYPYEVIENICIVTKSSETEWIVSE